MGNAIIYSMWQQNDIEACMHRFSSEVESTAQPQDSDRFILILGYELC